MHTGERDNQKRTRTKKELPHSNQPPKRHERDATHVRFTPTNICAVAATVPGVLISKHRPKLAKKQKNKVSGAGQHTQKVILQTK